MRLMGQKPILRSLVASLLFAFLTASIATVIGVVIDSPHVNASSLTISGAMMFVYWLFFAPGTGLGTLRRDRKRKADIESVETCEGLSD